MFGYVTINRSSLTEEQYKRFRMHYCGLCRRLGERYGLAARAVLSYDMTFLALLHSSLYEPEESEARLPCPARFGRRMDTLQSPAYDYAADMNIAFAYFKALDDAGDDRSLRAGLYAKGLEKSYRRVKSTYPDKCRKIEECIQNLSEMEKRGETLCDLPANLMGDLFAEVYAKEDDFWAAPLKTLGGAVGRFIYLCDAFEDLEEDIRKKRYNPLLSYRDRPDLRDFVGRSLTMLISEGADAFEMLPLEKDADILRNILYSGIWSRYAMLTQDKTKKKKHPLPGGE